MTMQTQYRSKVPNTGKKLKKKDCSSTATFRKIMGMPSNYLTVGNENTKHSKHKSSRSRLKTVDSKGKLTSVKDNKTANEGYGTLNDTLDHASSGKKKRSSNKKGYKSKQSPKPKVSTEFAQRLYSNNRSKDYQNKVKFHPLAKDPSTAKIRKSMNF